MPLHTDRQYEEELQQLRAKILEMGGVVEKQIGDAMGSLVERNSDQAREVIERDHTVNYLDVTVDETCTRLLALHQPAGRDLRLVMTSLKITTDLERIGDIAQNICERALELNPRMADAYLNRGLSRVYGQPGTREEMLADFERYLELGTNGYWRSEAYNQIARLKNQ